MTDLDIHVDERYNIIVIAGDAYTLREAQEVLQTLQVRVDHLLDKVMGG